MIFWMNLLQDVAYWLMDLPASKSQNYKGRQSCLSSSWAKEAGVRLPLHPVNF